MASSSELFQPPTCSPAVEETNVVRYDSSRRHFHKPDFLVVAWLASILLMITLSRGCKTLQQKHSRNEMK